jgi:tetratricopeptide (TPR) repeat protein
MLIVALGIVCTRKPSLYIDTTKLEPTAARLVQEHWKRVMDAPDSGKAWGELGALLKSYELREPALRCLKEAERLEPREGRWPYLVGLILATEEPRVAIEKFRRAVELSSHPAMRLRLGKILAEDGQLEAAERVLEGGMKHAPTRLALAHVAQQRGNLQKAEEHARACTQDGRTARGAWTLLAVIYQRAGKPEAADEAAQRAAQSPPELREADPFEAEALEIRRDPRWLSDMAQQYLRAGQLADARSVIAQLTNAHPNFAETWLVLGRLQLIEKRPAEAEQSFRRHLILDPESLNGTFQLGRALQEQQKFAGAAEVFKRTTNIKPDFGPGWFNLAVCLAKSGRKNEAKEPFRQAIRHNPEYLDSYILLADLHAQAGDADAALDLLNQADALRPGDLRVRGMKRRIESGAANKDLK